MKTDQNNVLFIQEKHTEQHNHPQQGAGARSYSKVTTVFLFFFSPLT